MTLDLDSRKSWLRYRAKGREIINPPPPCRKSSGAVYYRVVRRQKPLFSPFWAWPRPLIHRV